MKRYQLLIIILLVSLISSCESGNEEKDDQDLRYFQIQTNVGMLLLLGDSNASEPVFYTIVDDKAKNLVNQNIPEGCIPTPSPLCPDASGSNEKCPYKIPDYCPPYLSLWQYDGELTPAEYEEFAALLSTDRVRHYFEVACDKDKGCYWDHPGNTLVEYYFELFRIPSSQYNNRQKYISWRSVDQVKDDQFKDFLEKVIRFQRRKIDQFRRNNVGNLKKIGIKQIE